MDIWDIIPWIGAVLGCGLLIWGLISTIKEEGIGYVLVAAMLFASVFVFVCADRGLTLFLAGGFPSLSEDTAGVISRGLLIAFGIAWYLLIRKYNKKQ